MGRMFFGLSLATDSLGPRRSGAAWAADDAWIVFPEWVSERRRQPRRRKSRQMCQRRLSAPPTLYMKRFLSRSDFVCRKGQHCPPLLPASAKRSAGRVPPDASKEGRAGKPVKVRLVVEATLTGFAGGSGTFRKGISECRLRVTGEVGQGQCLRGSDGLGRLFPFCLGSKVRKSELSAISANIRCQGKPAPVLCCSYERCRAQMLPLIRAFAPDRHLI